MKRIVLMWFLVPVSLTFLGAGSVWAQTAATDRSKLKFGPTAVAKAPVSGLPRIMGAASIEEYVVQDFEGGVIPPVGWTLINPDTSYTWDTLSASSYGVGLLSAFVDNYDYSTAPAFDSLITPTITGLVATDSVKFDYAYTDYSSTYTDDSLFVDISTDNGATWTSLWREGGAGLRTRPSTTSFFIPTAGEWATRSFLVPAGVVGANVKIAFISRSNYGNNLFIDQIRIGTPPPPPLSGIKTIGGASPDYPTIKAAIQDLNAVGTEPPGVTFLIRSGTYAEDSLRIRTATSSATAPIVFKPDVGATVEINVAPPTTTYNFAIKIDTTQYVTIDGSNSGTTSRDMTINATGASGQRGVWVSGASHHATIKNCSITAGRDIATPTTSVRGIDFLYTGAAQNPNFVLAENNYIRHAYTGVRLEGNVAGDVMESPVVRNNVIDSVGNAGIYSLYHNDALFHGNDVNIMRGSSATIYGIFVGSTTARTRVYANKVHDIVQRSTSSITYGIYASGTSTLASHAIFNNFVWGISSPATATGAIYGIYDGTGNTTIADTIAYNTVNLTGSSTGNKTTAAFYKGSSTGPAYVRNNVFQNTRTDGTTGVAVAIFKTSTTTVLNSDNNNLYPGTPDAQHWTGRISTTNYATIADWRTANSSDVASVAENSPFISGTDLHMQTGVPTQLESGGTPVAGISADIDNDARHATAPDIGADEFAGIPLDLIPPVISYIPLGPTSQTTSRSLTATITDASGVPTASIGLPVLYWRINSGSYTGAQGVFVSGNTYSFTFGAGVVLGDTVSYFVAAQDNATTPNVTVFPLAGASGFTANPPAASTPPTSPSSYRVVLPPLAAGDYTVGLTLFEKATGRKLIPQTYTRLVQKEVPVGPESDPKSEGRIETTSSLTPFRQTALVEVEEPYSVLMENGRPYGGPTRVELSSAQKGELGLPDHVLAIYPTLTAAVADLNFRGVAGSVRFLLVDTTYTGETFPITVNVLSDSVPTASKTVTIKPSTGITATIAGASASGRILQVVNTSFVTIDGSNTNGGTTRNLTLQNTSTTSPSVILFGSMGTTPITNCSLKNTIVINGVYTSTPVIVSDVTAGNPGYFSDITIQNNAIRNGYHALYCNAFVAALNGANLLVAYNTIGSTATDSVRFDGVYIQGADGAIVRGNDIGGFSTVTAEADRGVWLASGTRNTLVEGNTIHDMNYGGTSGYGGKGVVVSSGLANCNNTVQNNMIFNLTGDSDSYSTYGATYSPSGIYAFGTGQTGVNIFYNSIYLYGNTINNDAQCYSIGIALDDGTVGSVLNNLIVNNLGLLVSTGVGPVAIAAEVSNAQFTAINYNDYFTNAAPPAVNNIGKIGASDYATLPAWAAASGGDLQSMSVNANFLSSTNLHIDTTQATPLDSGAVTIVGVTTDFDGQTRNATAPDIGADEFTYSPPTSHDIGVSALVRIPALTDTVYFRALVSNFGGFDEASYNVTWSIDGVTQATVSNTATLEIGDVDTVFFQWNSPTVGPHTAQAWTVLAADANAANDSSSTAFTFSQALAGGTYTIGSGGNFPTLDSAFTKLEVDGVSGAVTFQFIDSVYDAQDDAPATLRAALPHVRVDEFDAPNVTGETAYFTATETDAVDTVGALTLTGPIPGASSTNTVTFQSASGVNARIIGNGTSVIRLLNASWVRLNNFTVQSLAGDAVVLEGNSDNNIVQNMTIWAPFTAGVGVYMTASGAATPDNNTVQNNAIKSAVDGVVVIGSTTAFPLNNAIAYNTFGAPTDSIGEVAIYAQQAFGTIIHHNNIQNVRQAGTTFNVAGIWVATKHLGTKIYNNVVRDVKVGSGSSSAVFAAGLYLFGASGDTTSGDYYNNMFYNLDNQGTSTSGTIRGMYLSTGRNDTAAYNSIYITGTDPSAKLTGGLYTSTHTGQVFRNNNVDVRRTATGTGRAIAFYKLSTTSTISSNYNNLYVPVQTGSYTAAVTTTNYATLANWQSIGYDSNSVASSVNYVAPHLHIDSTQATPLNAGATPIAGITTDYDGQTRHATTPDIGADEFTLNPPQVPYFDNFEAYTVGQRLACQNPTYWTTWSNLPCNTTEDPLISSAQAFSGTKSVVIVQNNDLVKRLGMDTTGIHRITFKFYVPSGKAGYFNTLATYQLPSTFNWAMETYFDSAASGNNGRLFAGQAGAIPFSYAHNAWQTAMVQVNLGIDSARFFINGTLVRVWRWTAGASGSGSPRRLAANDFFGATAWDQMYMDDYDIHQDTVWTGVDEEVTQVPETFALMQNYPNPFNPATKIQFALPTESFVTLKVYNILGQEVVTLMDGGQQAGYFTTEWNGRNQYGSPVASGVYFYRIEARPVDGSQAFTGIKKMLFLK